MRRHPERERRDPSRNSSINYPRVILAATLLLLFLYFGYRALSILLLGAVKRVDVVPVPPPQNLERANPEPQRIIPQRPIENIFDRPELRDLQQYYQQAVANQNHADFYVRRQAQNDLVQFRGIEQLPADMQLQAARVMRVEFQNRLQAMRQNPGAEQMPDNHGAAREIGLFGRQNQFADQNYHLREIRRNEELNQANRRRF